MEAQSTNRKPRIGIILGSASDLRLMKRCQQILDDIGEPYEMIAASAHRTPAKVQQWAEGAEARGLQAIIAAAGAAAALPGVVAAHTLVPVIGLPLDTTQLRGVDSLYSIVQMPPGIPVATVGINNGDNAALMALQIIAGSDSALREKLSQFRKQLVDKVEKGNEDLYQDRPDLRPQDAAPPSEPASSARIESAVPSTRQTRRVKIDLFAPDEGILNRVMDTLIDGGVVALPTDTVYGLAADATSRQGVQKLFSLKNRPEDQAIPLLIPHSKMLAAIAAEIPKEAEALFEKFWPGALSIVFKKYPGSFKAAAPGETVAVRIPECEATIEVLLRVGRPLAVTSANLSGGRPALDAESIEREFGDRVDLILDAGPLGPGKISTVISVASRPFEILRQGAVARGPLKEALGALLAG